MPPELVYTRELAARLGAPEKFLPHESPCIHSFSRLLALSLKNQFTHEPEHRIEPEPFSLRAGFLAARLEAMHEPELESMLGRDPTELADGRALFGLEHEQYLEMIKSIPRIAKAVASDDYAKEVEKHIAALLDKIRNVELREE